MNIQIRYGVVSGSHEDACRQRHRKSDRDRQNEKQLPLLKGLDDLMQIEPSLDILGAALGHTLFCS
jgi:hypothetical protein